MLDKMKLLIISILSIFLWWMLLAGVCVTHAKTGTIYPKSNTTIKLLGKYAILCESFMVQ